LLKNTEFDIASTRHPYRAVHVTYFVIRSK